MKFLIERVKGRPDRWIVYDEAPDYRRYVRGDPVPRRMVPVAILNTDMLAQSMTTPEFSALVNAQGPVAIDFAATPQVDVPEGLEDLSEDESDAVDAYFNKEKINAD